MIYLLNGTVLDKNNLKDEETMKRHPCLGVLSKSEVESWNSHLCINERILSECLTGQSSKFESHEGFDYIALHIPDKVNPTGRDNRISIYFRYHLLIFICEELCEYSILSGIISKIQMKEIKKLTLERILYEFFDQLTIGDSVYLENMEQEISDLEEALITSKKRNYIREIIRFRKKLLVMKRYYEQLQTLSCSLEDNENGLISKELVRYFHMLSARVNRLSDSVSNLRDYVSQVREAYQSQVDIDQNSIMKFFTVITSIFLPLSLIAGWYGMNFNMPEYNHPHSYAAVIIVSLGVALCSLLYFKKNEWF